MSNHRISRGIETSTATRNAGFVNFQEILMHCFAIPFVYIRGNKATKLQSFILNHQEVLKQPF